MSLMDNGASDADVKLEGVKSRLTDALQYAADNNINILMMMSISQNDAVSRHGVVAETCDTDAMSPVEIITHTLLVARQLLPRKEWDALDLLLRPIIGAISDRLVQLEKGDAPRIIVH